MTELTPPERDAIAHWAHYGKPGDPVTERYIPDEAERARFKDFVAPQNGVWPDRFDAAQTLLLLNGFPRGAMEDKWIIYSDDPRPDGTTSVHFHRSWTGLQVVQVDLALDADGSRCVGATWEMDTETLKNPSEAFARESFVEVCRWVLRMKPAD
ncbi:hypothetical protein BH10ACT7_BH10ACT7_16450 [soil metagenome]